ncbi:hypothetical protein COV58_02830, partial [Candidatus Roizmanbacteria bacterium CG11_big_fil_rev_8_21_14_0_20_36_8]
IESGVTLIDTAQNYAAGKCEELVGEAVKKYPRSAYRILTKQNKEFLSYEDVLAGAHASMKRMGISYIDYFLCHSPNPDFDMQDFFRATNKLYKDKLIRNVGVSNFGPKSLEIAIKTSELPILFNQVNFSIDNDDIFSSGTYDFCIKHNILIQAFRTLTNIDANEDAKKMLQILMIKYKISKQQLVLAYLNNYKDVIFTIRASSKTHWEEIKQAMEIKLEKSDIEKLRETHVNKHGDFGELLLI